MKTYINDELLTLWLNSRGWQTALVEGYVAEDWAYVAQKPNEAPVTLSKALHLEIEADLEGSGTR